MPIYKYYTAQGCLAQGFTVFWNWKKFEWYSISQKSSGDRQEVYLISDRNSSKVPKEFNDYLLLPTGKVNICH